MPRAARVIQPANGDQDDLPEYDHVGLNAWRASGDYAALSDPSFADWEWTVYRLHTPDEVARLRTSGPRLWLGRTHGPLDLSAIQSSYGGGSFELWGKFDGRLLCRPQVDIAGQRKDFSAAPVAAPAAAAPAGAALDPTLARILENQQRTLDRLEAASRIPVPAAAAPFGIKDAFELFDRMQPRVPDGGQLGELVSAFREGIELGKAAEGTPAADKTELILKAVMPAVERVAGAILSSRGRPSGPRPAPASRSGAHVVDTPLTGATEEQPVTETTTVVAEVEGAHRMQTAIEVLANSMAAGDEPADAADTIGRILQPQEVWLFCQASDAEVVDAARTTAGGRFPLLERPEAVPFITAVLAELKRPVDDAA